MSTPIAEIADWIDDLEFVLEDGKALEGGRGLIHQALFAYTNLKERRNYGG